MPVMAHPFTGSWGYQVTSYFAPDPRLRLARRLPRASSTACTGAGIGVILDWVPAHFPRDDWALARFDGTALYEHEDPRRGAHPDWGTLVFNLGRNEVRNFLLANALFWLREYHADGLRVDAVASMLYRDYSRERGRVDPQRVRRPRGPRGGRVPAGAQRAAATRACRASITVAEESTAWPGVSRPTYLGGLGFGFKWNMGWMHDTLGYFAQDPIYRRYHHHELTFSMIYAFSENFILPLCHDEVVHGKGSLLGKMPGDRWQRFANLRALYGYMWAHPGKKLLFMGQEFAQEARVEPRALARLAPARAAPSTPACRRSCATSTAVYRGEPALWERDFEPGRLSLARGQRRRRERARVRSHRARCRERMLVCVVQLSPDRPRGLPRRPARAAARWRELLNTDSRFYGGDRRRQRRHASQPSRCPGTASSHSAALTLPPLAVLWLVPEAQCPSSRATLDATPGADGAALAAARLGARPARRRHNPVSRLGAARADGARAHRRRGAGAGRRRASTSTRGSRRVGAGADYQFVLRAAERRPAAGAARPQLAPSARGPARTLARARYRRLRLDRRAAGRRRPAAELVLYELHVGAFTAAGTFARGRGASAGACGTRRQRRRADAGRRLSRRARLGLRRRLPVRGAPRLRRARRPRRASSTPRTAPASRSCSTSSTTTSGASGVSAMEAFGPYFTDKYQTFWGKAINYDDARLRRRFANGCCRAPAGGCATSTSTVCASTPSTRSTTRARRTSWPSWSRACTRPTRGRS